MGTDAFSTEMFWGRDDTIQFVAALESQVLMMPDDDQVFVTGCRMHLETGGVLNQDNLNRLTGIGKYLLAARHNTMGGSLTIKRVLTDLAGAIHTLNAQEKQFAGKTAKKFTTKQPISEEETTQLLMIYSAKGF